MAKNPIRKVWEENRAAYGSWLVVPGSFGAELMARVGVDYVCVDVQHGILGYDAMVPMFQAISAAGNALLRSRPGIRRDRLERPGRARRRGAVPRYGGDAGGPE